MGMNTTLKNTFKKMLWTNNFSEKNRIKIKISNPNV